jgi:uncharacterized protein involved in exopolysaccharide biosynthesis
MVGVDRWVDTAFTSDEFEDPGHDPGPPISVRSLRSAIRRRRRLWVITAFAGLVLGAALHLVLPHKVTAVSKLYLDEPADSNPTLAIGNDLSLLQTRSVAQAAMSSLHMSPTQPIITYQGATEGTSILTIKVTAPSGQTAVAWNKAVAQAFLSVRAQLQNGVTGGTVASLQSQIQTLQSQVQQLSGGSSPAGAAQQAGDLAQISALNRQIQQARGDQASVTKNSVVLDSAYIIPSSVKKTALKDGLSGLVAGLGLGLTIVIIGELLSDRVRNRGDVAAALGAPVDLSVGRLP